MRVKDGFEGAMLSGRMGLSRTAHRRSRWPSRVLLATDGSEEAELAARAVEEAEATGSELHVVHVGRLPNFLMRDPDVVGYDCKLYDEIEQESRERLRKLTWRVKVAGGTVAASHLRIGWPEEEIVRLGEDDLVVELGAGGGMLTRQLARKTRRVIAVECDPYWALHLRERFSEDENVHVVQADALTVTLPREPFRVVANVPFYATTPILHRLLDDPTGPLDEAHLLVQKQVALKHARTSPTTLKTLNWSPWYRFSAGLELPADVFHPKPKVDACLLRAARRDPPLVDPRHRHLFRALVRLGFDGRGNTVGNVLRTVFTRTQHRRLARDNGFSPDAFPSKLDAHQWARVFGFMIRAVPQDRWPSTGRQGL